MCSMCNALFHSTMHYGTVQFNIALSILRGAMLVGAGVGVGGANTAKSNVLSNAMSNSILHCAGWGGW